ncbi:hypothetical protein Ahy_B04g072615 [Arachis hypogaea]|uniref:Uncharacterized protein n=1 Tax=Arachis hypogaea TaxID=3818 RepID=A0A444ZND1_ARAHY|nr:hypothetical protein Ahy_B04g072615 [Arachis hypogaea]
MSHLLPLHISTTLSGIKVNKVLIDGGVAISLLPERMLMKVRKHPDDLVPTNIASLNVDRTLNSYNCEGSYLSSEGLAVKLCYPELDFTPTEYGVEAENSKVEFKRSDKSWLRRASLIHAAAG